MEISQFKEALTTIKTLENGLYLCPNCGREDPGEMFLGMEFVNEWKIPSYIGFVHKNPHCFTLIMCPELDRKEALGS